MSSPISDADLTDVRESAELTDWCIVCAGEIINGDCQCEASGFTNPSPVSVRAVLARIDDGSRRLLEAVHNLGKLESDLQHIRESAGPDSCADFLAKHRQGHPVTHPAHHGSMRMDLDRQSISRISGRA